MPVPSRSGKFASRDCDWVDAWWFIGGILSWIGFTLPSVLLLMAFAWLISSTASFDIGWIKGLKIVAVAVVAHALVGMGKSLTPDRTRITLALGAAVLTLLIPTAIGQIAIIVGAGFIGYALYRKEKAPKPEPIALSFGKKTGVAAWAIFFLLLIGVPVIRAFFQNTFIVYF